MLGPKTETKALVTNGASLHQLVPAQADFSLSSIEMKHLHDFLGHEFVPCSAVWHRGAQYVGEKEHRIAVEQMTILIFA